MSKISLSISQGYRYFFYIVLGCSLFTGTGFWLIRRFGTVNGDFGPESHFLQYPLLQVHGLAAFLMMMSLGAVFASHIPKTWSSKRSRKSGITLLSWVTLSVLTAYVLYYLVSEDWHEWLGNGHAILGLSLPLFLIIHIKLARSSSKSKKYKSKRQAKRDKKEKRRTHTELKCVEVTPLNNALSVPKTNNASVEHEKT